MIRAVFVFLLITVAASVAIVAVGTAVLFVGVVVFEILSAILS